MGNVSVTFRKPSKKKLSFKDIGILSFFRGYHGGLFLKLNNSEDENVIAIDPNVVGVNIESFITSDEVFDVDVEIEYCTKGIEK